MRSAPPRLLLVGPCGVGKSAIGRLVASRFPAVCHLEVDALRGDGREIAPGCSASYLDLDECLTRHLEGCPSGYVVDLGGDTVFRRDVDNDDRARQVQRFKQKHELRIFLLVAPEAVARQRFLSSKSRTPEEFDGPWRDWCELAEPRWRGLADEVLDTAAFRLGDAAQEEAMLNLLLDWSAA